MASRGICVSAPELPALHGYCRNSLDTAIDPGRFAYSISIKQERVTSVIRPLQLESKDATKATVLKAIRWWKGIYDRVMVR